MNNTALAVRTDTMDDWQIIRQQAEVLVKTGFLPQSIKTPEQAMAVILTGRELGIGAMAALQTINVIQGKPTVSPQLMLALINRTNQVEDIKIDATKDGATCTIKRSGRSPYTARFGPAEASAMGLSGKDNYKKQPATMYKWRAVADACRATFADVILGVYTPDEMGAAVEVETGEVLDVSPSVGDASQFAEAPTAEPEPVRDVKLEGAQPASKPLPPTWPQHKKYAPVFGKCEALRWTPGMLANEIQKRFELAVSGDPVLALEALNGAELKELDQALAAEFKVGKAGGRK